MFAEYQTEKRIRASLTTKASMQNPQALLYPRVRPMMQQGSRSYFVPDVDSLRHTRCVSECSKCMYGHALTQPRMTCTRIRKTWAHRTYETKQQTRPATTSRSTEEQRSPNKLNPNFAHVQHTYIITKTYKLTEYESDNFCGTIRPKPRNTKHLNLR